MIAADHDPEWLAECREKAPGYTQRFVTHIGQGERLLASPGCPKGCAPCFRECAVRGIVADTWTRDWQDAETVAACTLQHAGRVYAHLSGRA